MENVPNRSAETSVEQGAAEWHALAPATGVDVTREPKFAEHEEPVVTGTLFLTLIFLMMILGFWVTVYYMLITR